MQHEIRQIMENSHLFEGLQPQLIDEIASSATRRAMGAGEILFQKGDPADALWGVLSGRIVIEVVTDDGKEMVLDNFVQGEVFGEVGVIDFGPRRVEARATQESELFRLERTQFLKHLQNSPELCFRVFTLLCSHLRQTTENLEDTALYKLPNRLAKRLTMLAADAGASDYAVLHIAQSDLASLLGVNRETVNRHLRVFEKDGLIRLKRQRIEIVDQQALADLASPGQNGQQDEWGNENLAALNYRAKTRNPSDDDSPILQGRHSAGLMAIDAAEYSRSLMTDAAGTLKRIEAGLKAVDQAIEQYQGHTVWHTGDRVLTEFPDAQLAIRAALAIQEKVNPAKHTGKGKQDLLFRIGVHHGEVLAQDHRFSGEAVTTVIRLTRLSDAGGIAISGTVRDMLGDGEQLELQFLGDHELKNVSGSVPVYSARTIPRLKMLALRAQTLLPRRYRPALALGVVLLAIAVIWQAGEHFGAGKAMGPSTQSIAVMSFILEGDPERAWLADSLAQEIRTALATIPETVVIGRKSSEYFEDWNATAQEIGEVLQVAYILKGSVDLKGEELKVSSHLVETSSGVEIWNHDYQGSWQELNSIRADIVRFAGETLNQGIPGDRLSFLAPPITENQEAYVLYLQARELINSQTRASLVGALAKLKKALALAPDFASAHVAIAETYLYLTGYTDYYEGLRDAQILARPHVERALAIDSELAQAYVIQGRLLDRPGSSKTDSYKEELAYLKAISLNPNLASAQMWLGIRRGNQMRPPSEYLPHLEKAHEIEPLWIEAATILVEFLQYFPDRRDQARAIIAHLKTRRPDHPSVNLLEAFWLQLEGHSSEAVPLLEKILILDPTALWARFQLNIAWFSLGETKRALDAQDWQRQWRFVLSPDHEESLGQMKKIDDDPAISAFINRNLSAYIYVMLREWQSAVDALAEHSQDLNGFRKHHAGNLAKGYSPAMSLAVAYKALGDDEQYEKFIEIEQKALATRWDNGRIHNFEYSRAMARINALEGRPNEAMLELKHLITAGPNDPRELMHPAFDNMHKLPGFRELRELQRHQVNEERAKLGLASIPVE
jgi:CRP-like cAMP-binding protein/TolB-like protein/class 3 adenylate cyclase